MTDNAPMVERVRLALKASLDDSLRGAGLDPKDWHLDAAARAALGAMREPTEGMIAAWNTTEVDTACPCERRRLRDWSNEDIQEWVNVNARRDWRAMIDAALERKT